MTASAVYVKHEEYSKVSYIKDMLSGDFGAHRNLSHSAAFTPQKPSSTPLASTAHSG
jgi:hypothetical protein